MTRQKARVLEIDPLTRVEGHGKVTVHLDENNQVSEARLHIVEFRGFERFIQGRMFWEVPVIVQRLCGICPVSHHLAAAKAMDMIVGAKQITPTAEKMRRLMHYGQVMQSNVLHFFHLCSPDLLFGFSAPAKKRNIFEVIKEHPELAKRGILMRKFGQEVILHTAVKKIHGNTAVPGGINKNLSLKERDLLLPDADQMIDWAFQAVQLVKKYSHENLELFKHFANFDSSHMSLVAQDGAMDLYHGNLRAVDARGDSIFDQVNYEHFDDYIQEEVKPWSYMKFPFIKEQGKENGWYRVGPLARMNTSTYIDTPLANSCHQEFKTFFGPEPAQMSLAYHWARLIEVLHCAEKIKQLLHDPDLQGTDLITRGERQENGVAMIEAPRGSLFHQYKVDEHDQVTYCNLIVATTHNNTAMNLAVTDVAKRHLSGQNKVSEAMLNHIEVAVRAYDPCLSCATHALGQMPLKVELYDAENKMIDSASQFTDGIPKT
jgi:NAD-reducing hydrogenase large subunit